MTQEQLNAIWPGWVLVRKLGQGSYGGVYEIQRTLPGGKTERSAMKKISIPKSQDEIELLLAKSVPEQSITAHYQQQMQKLVGEYTMMRELDACPNIVTSQDLNCQPNGYGWDIYFRMELLRPLKQVLDGQYREMDVLRIGMDICSALKECETINIIHRDIKPENILVSASGEFKLGDFGIAKTSEKTQTGTMAGTYGYMAPEVANRQHYGRAADIYSLGMVLYWLMNNETLPFLPLPPRIPTPQQRQAALNRRFSGEALPEPQNGSWELMQIVLKACAYLPENRYHSAGQLFDALSELYSTKQESTEKILHELGLTGDILAESPWEMDISQPEPPRDIQREKLVKKPRNRIAVLAVLAIVTISAIFAVTAFLIPSSSNPPRLSEDGAPQYMESTISPTETEAPVPSDPVQTEELPSTEASAVFDTEVQTQPTLPEIHFTYELSNEGVTITGIQDGSVSEFTIPDTLDGRVVTKIGKGAFLSNQTIKKVVLPDSVQEIEEKAFSGCIRLQSVTFSKQLSRIGAGAFENCSSLSGAILPEGLSNIAPWAFANCTRLTSISIPGSVTEVGEWALSGCTGLSDVQFHAGDLSIANYVFCNCRRLTEIVIPDGTTSIGLGAFSGCEKLTQVQFPNTLHTISSKAFQNTAITSVSVPQYCSIGDSAFPLGCTITKMN